jgi:hypothetical protein
MFLGADLELQPAFERGFNIANDATVEFSRSFANEFASFESEAKAGDARERGLQPASV